jgi:hypothetical protein
MHSVWAVCRYDSYGEKVMALYDNETAAQEHCAQLNAYALSGTRYSLSVLQIRREYRRNSAP